MDNKWSNADVARFLGATRGSYLTYAHDEEVRGGAASGGATTQILISALEKGIIDGALVWKMGTRDGRPCAEPLIATDRESLLAARTSLYVAVNFARDGMPAIQGFSGRLAVVALPCDATYLKRRMAKSPDLDAKIAGILTLFCGHNSLPELTEVVCARHGFDWTDLKSFSYRTGTWRGPMTMTPKEGPPVQVSTRQFTHMQNLHVFSEKKCLACFDHFGFDGDLSLGDSWALGEKSRDIKPTVCTVRTEAGQRLFDAARDALHVEDTSPSHVLSGNSRGLIYHYNVSARSQVARAKGHAINDRLRIPTTFVERLIARIGVGNALWSWRDEAAREKLIRTPWWRIKARIYAFKGLQELNSHAFRRYPDNRQISLIGATVTGNQGAAAMLETSIGEVSRRFPGAQFVVHSYFPDADRAACRAPNVRVVDAAPKALVLSFFPAMLDRVLRPLGLRVPTALMTESLRELRNSAVLLDISGISLADGREKFLPFNLLCVWPAHLTGTPVVKLSQAMGPARGCATRMVARFVFRRMERIFARGEKTAELIAPVAPPEKVSLAADIAFSYREEYALIPGWSDRLDPLIATIKAGNARTVAISVSSVVKGMVDKNGQSYADMMAATVRRLLDDGLRVVVFPNACRENTDSTRNNDIPVIAELGRKLDAHERLHLVDHVVNTAAIRKLLAASDALITSRFHAMVAALSLSVPTLVLGWSHKYQEVMAMFGTEGRFLGADDMATDRIAAAVDELLTNSAAIRAEIGHNLPEVEASSSAQFDWLDGLLQPEAAPEVADG